MSDIGTGEDGGRGGLFAEDYRLRQVSRFHVLVEMTSHLTVICTLIAGIASFWYQIAQDKRDAAFELISRLNDSPMLEVQQRVQREVIELPLAELQGQTVDRDLMLTLFEQLVATSQQPVSLVQDLVTLAGYYDEVQICVDTGTCDGVVVQARITDRAGRFACLAMPFIHSIRDRYLLEGLGDGLSRMVKYEDIC